MDFSAAGSPRSDRRSWAISLIASLPLRACRTVGRGETIAWLWGHTSRARAVVEHEPFREPTEPQFGYLRIAGTRRSDYWINLAVEADTTLVTLDSFLRKFLLDWCGYLSAFAIVGT